MDKRKVLNVQSRVSEHNIFVNESLPSVEYYNAFGKLQEVNSEAGRRVVEDIVDSLFPEEHCREQGSISNCSIQRQPEPCETMDKRLKQWYDTLRDRAKLQMKLSKRTGRHPMQMLCNLPVSADSHEKGNMLRLMDLASRMHPQTLNERQYGMLPALKDRKQCVRVPEVWQTRPKPEREEKAIEAAFSGLPTQAKAEVLGARAAIHDDNDTTKRHTRWINSKALADNIANNRDKISRVLKYCPRMNNLEVRGQSVLLSSKMEHTSNISLVQHMSLRTISSTTAKESDVVKPSVPIPKVAKPRIINLGININGISYAVPPTDGTQAFPSLSIHFECAPFQRQVKEVVRLENIGRKIITCEWHLGNSLHHLSKEYDDCFLISHTKFKLFPGDLVSVRMMFQPRSVFVRRQRCALEIYHNTTKVCQNSIVLKLSGKCIPSPEYCQQIDKQMKAIVDKATCSIATTLTNCQAELVPLIKPHEQPCPYERPLDEREVFNSLNLGYRCERFDDIEKLRSLYNALKMPRHPPWDLRLDTIKQLILHLPKLEDRELHYQTLLESLDSLGRGRDEPLIQDGHSCEQERSCFIYVRGCVANSIEEWVELMDALELSCLKVELTRLFLQAKAEQAEEEEEQEEPEEKNEEDQNKGNNAHLQLKWNNPVLYVLNKIGSRKYFQDALYIQTYTQVCDMAENVASIIESTRII